MLYEKVNQRLDIIIKSNYHKIKVINLKYRCRDTINNDSRMTLGSYVKGLNNIICRVWA